MKIRLLRLGSAAHSLELTPGATLQTAIDSAGLGSAGYDLTVNGMSTTSDAALAEGDVVTMVPRIKGGRTTAA